MRVIRGLINAILMVTLIKPMVRLTVGRWRKRAQESTAASIGIPVQELFEVAFIEELTPAVEDLGAAPVEDVDVVEVTQAAAGRSFIRVVLIAGVVIIVTTAVAYGVAELLRRRREEEGTTRNLVAVPVEGDEAEEFDDTAVEAVAEEG